MGAIIKGKEYRRAKCIKCNFEWQTTEMTINGICSETVKLFEKYGYACKVGDDICLGCQIDLFGKEDLKNPRLNAEPKERFKRIKRTNDLYMQESKKLHQMIVKRNMASGSKYSKLQLVLFGFDKDFVEKNGKTND